MSILQQKESGLSLIELMIVVSIISILAASATQQYNLYTLKTKCNLSALVGDLNGNYMYEGTEITHFLNALAVDFDEEDVISRRKSEWSDFNRDQIIDDKDLIIFTRAFLNFQSNKCLDNGFKSHYHSDLGSVSRYQIPDYTE